ncbi:MAG: apolipoprotein N-acyltransferase, partial [Bdellovibrionales bacterium]|nr:apolipoprotein N-acyltransferase [Bdellovibrionales bacterium]
DTVRNIEPIRASLIQGNISQDQKWERQARKNILETYALLSSESMLNKNIDLVIWPEAAIPYLTPRRSLQTSFPVDFLKGQSYLIYGAATYATQGRKRNYYNSAFFSAPNGEHLGAYDKKRLVPFGEYVPFEKWIKGIVPAMAGNFSRGDKTFVFHHDKFHFSVIICYEVLFPELSIDMVNNGAEFFVNITNDAWFDVTSGPFQHAHIGRFRAIETRRSFLRAANTGITYWITPSGQIFDATRLFKSTTVIAKIYPSQEKTFYVHFPWLVPFLMLVIVIYGIFKNRQHG